MSAGSGRNAGSGLSPVDSPKPLLDIVADAIASKVDLTGVLDVHGGDVFVHAEIAEMLVEKISLAGKLDDDALAIFAPENTRLSRVRVPDASKLTTRGLKTLRGHDIVELEATGLAKATISELIGCLGDETVRTMKTFSVPKSTVMDVSKHYAVMVPISRLKGLTTLNVAGTEFNRTSLEMVVDDLPLLESIDISRTKVSDYTSLRKIRHRLKSLSAFDVKLTQPVADATVEWLPEMTELVHLDISVEVPEANALSPFGPQFNHGKISSHKLLKDPDAFPKLVSLDLSGKEDVDANELIYFLQAHPAFKFIGLAATEACKDDAFTDESNRFYNPDLAVTGSATIRQARESMRRYLNRMHYVQKSLYYMFRHTQVMTEANPELIELVVKGASAYNSVFAIQMAATACLFNLSRGEIGPKLHPRILGQIVKVDLKAMEEFPQHQQLQKNVLLTICTDRILQEVSFDKFLCSRLVLNCLCSFEEDSMKRMSVAIISILAARISTQETSQLGSEVMYMKKLLELVLQRVDNQQIDITLKFTLSALWNLTDESPSTCSVFLNEGGMDLFLQVLQVFPDDISIETKVLGLLNNIAEVSHLRENLMVKPFIGVLRKLMQSKHIDVSYFAAGIIAHLTSNDHSEEAWVSTAATRKEILSDLYLVVSKWKTPEEEMVAYRSFRPFFPLMGTSQPYPVQMWAVWAINHVCSKNATRYCPMLVKQGGSDVIMKLLEDSETHIRVIRLCESIVKSLRQEGVVSKVFVDTVYNLISKNAAVSSSSSTLADEEAKEAVDFSAEVAAAAIEEDVSENNDVPMMQ